MHDRNSNWTEYQIERVISNLLRGGVILAASVVLLGGVLYLIHYGNSEPNYRVFHGEPSDLRTLSGITQDALSGRRRGLIQLGLLLLIATPIVRVGFTAIAFIRQRDYLFVGITFVVLGVLLYSLIGLMH